MTLSVVWQFVRGLAVAMLVPLLGMPPSLSAQTHVVSPGDFERAAVAASADRQHNLETVTGFLSSPRVAKALTDASLDPAQLKTAVSALSDQELARLAARAEHLQADFAGGFSNRDLLILILGFAILILIIVAVHH